MILAVPLRLADPPAPTADALYRQYARYVARLAFRLVGRDGDVDDLVQDVFLAATAAKVKSSNEHELKGWLSTVTVRLASKRLRRRRLARFFGFDDAPDERLLSPGASPEMVTLVAQLYRRLDSLPTAERLAWTLRHVENEPLEEVARVCGCSLATAKRRIAAVQAALTETDHEA